MFQFTREFIINDLKGNLIADAGITLLGAENTSKIAQDANHIYIENLINIDKKSIHKVYKTAHVPASKEVVTWNPTLNGIESGDIVRIIATLYQEDNVVATFASAVPNTGRTIQYEFVAMGTTLVNTVKPVEDLYAIMEVDSTEGITITAKDCFTHVGKIEIVKDAVSDSNVGVGAIKVASVKKGDDDFDITTEGTPGLGNTAQILRNMRLQTDANLNPYGLDIDERPFSNGQYDMYTVELVTERRNIGHNVMGSVGVSLTTLVFYVLKGEVSNYFATLFDSVNTVTNGKSDMGTTGEGETGDDVVVTGKEPGIILDDETDEESETTTDDENDQGE